MPDWTTYKGLDIPDATPTGTAGLNLKDDLKLLADGGANLSTSDPSSTDDSTKGYFVGSLWLNTADQTMFVCTDATASSAVWKSFYKRTASKLSLLPDDDGEVDVNGGFALKPATITANTTLDESDNVVLCNNTTDITVTLPAASGIAGRTYYIKKINSSTNTVTIDGNASETIDGATTLVLYVQYDAVRILCDGTNWFVVSDELIAHKARMTQTTSQTLATATTIPIDFDTEDFDVGGIASTATNKFTIRRAGQYLITAEWAPESSLDASEIIQGYITVNNTAVTATRARMPVATNVITVLVTDVLDLAANDDVEFEVRHDDGEDNATRVSNPLEPRMSVIEQR